MAEKKKIPLTEEQQRFVDSYPKKSWSSETTIDAQMAEKVFNVINASGDEQKGLEYAREITKGESDRIFQEYTEFNQTYSTLAAGGSENPMDTPSALGIDQEAPTGSFFPAPEPKKLTLPDEELKKRSINASLVNGSVDQDGGMVIDPKVMEAVAATDDEPYREQAKSTKVSRASAGLTQLIKDGETDEGILAASIGYINQEKDKANRLALEQEAVDKAMEFAQNNPEWAQLGLYHEPYRNFLAKDTKKREMARSFIAKKIQERDEDGALLNFLAGFANTAKDILGDELWSGSRLRNWGAGDQYTLDEFNKMLLNVDVGDFEDALNQWWDDALPKSSLISTNIDRMTEYATAITGTGIELDDANFGHGLEVALTAIPYVGLAGYKMLGRVGNTSTLSRDASRAMDTGDVEGTVFSSVDEVVQESIPVAPSSYENIPGLSASIEREMAISAKMMDDMAELSTMERLTPDELTEAVRRRRVQLEKLYGKTQMVSGTVNFDNLKGVHMVDMMIGKRDGAGFVSESNAQRAMTKKRIDGDIVETPTGWYIKQSHPVTESMADKGFMNYPVVGDIKLLLQGPKAFVDRALGMQGTAASLNESKISSDLRKVVNKRIYDLPKQEFKEVNELLNVSLKADSRKWMSVDELQDEANRRWGKDLSDAQVLAYSTAKQVSDFGHFLDNRKVFQEKASRGLETIRLSTFKDPFEGNVYTDAGSFTKFPGNARVLRVDTNTVSNYSEQEMKDFLKQGYIAVRPDDPSFMFDELGGDAASYILVKKTKDMKVTPLEFNQVNYLAGGRREYKAPFFIGQHRSGTFSDGTRYTRNPLVLRTAQTKEAAQKWIDETNAANSVLAAYRAGQKSGEEAEALIYQYKNMSLREFEEEVADGGWDIERKMLMKKNREDFPVEDYGVEDMVRMYNPESFETQFGVRKSGRLSGRGDEVLKDVSGEDTEIYDFMGAMNRSIDRAISAGVYNDFRISAINRFNTSFRQYINNADRLTPYEIATRGEIKPEIEKDKPEVFKAIKAHRLYINSMLHNKGWWDTKVERTMDKFADWLEKTPAKGLSASIRDAQDPIAKIRSINYSLTLGLLNPAQFAMQANSVLVGISLSPRFGLAAAKDIPLMRYALIANDPNVTSELVRRAGGLTEGLDLVKNAEQFKRIGLNDFGANLAMIDAQNSITVGSSQITNKARRLHEKSLFFFQEGERYGRLTAYGIARRKYAEKFPGKDPFAKHADQWIREESDRLLFSPTSDNNPLLTKGIGSIPTQFWSYMMKLSDAVVTGQNGRFTPRERVQLAAGQLLFYGTAGLPALDWALNSYEESTGTTFDPVTAKALHNGLVDTLIYVASDGDVNTDFSGSSGMGGWVQQVAQTLHENPITAVAAGPVGVQIKSALDRMQHAALLHNTWDNPTPENVSAVALAGIGGMIKSVDRTTRAILAYNTGIWYDKYSRPSFNMTKSEAVAYLGGLNPQDQSDLFAAMKNQEGVRESFVNSLVPVVRALHDKYVRAETDKERKAIQDQINALAAVSMQTGHWNDVASGVKRQLGSSTFYDYIMGSMSGSAVSGKDGYNKNLLPAEFREQLIQQENK